MIKRCIINIKTNTSYFLYVCCFFILSCKTNKQETYQSIISGVPWYTEDGSNISAHGANIVKEGETFYLFGEYKNNENNQFEGFSCYSSNDLTNWRFEGIALPPNSSGRLSGKASIGERPKVMKSPSTGEFIMYFHSDYDNYRNPAVEYAVAEHITGPYNYKGKLLFNGESINRWDMGTFQDEDGSGYILMHHGDIYKLAADYKSIEEHVLHRDEILKTESPAVFKNNGIYYWIGSGLTGWERNDNTYYTAKSLSGPWKEGGIIAPKGSLTWNSQSTYVFPVKGSKTTTYMYMGDRWSFPKQRATATYVWQPLLFDKDKISMPEYQESWSIDTQTGEWKEAPLKPATVISLQSDAINLIGNWKNNEFNGIIAKRANDEVDELSIEFKGTQIALRGIASIDCGYGKVSIEDRNGKIVHETWIDMYSNKTVERLQYLSPKLQKGAYILKLAPTGSHWYWKTKSGKEWGSKNTYISISQALIF